MFNNPIASGSGGLVLPSIHSPDYTTSGGVTGWSINRDGTATFNTLGGSVQITNQGIFFYVPTPGSGNLVASFSDVGGFDQYGHQFICGFFPNQHQAHITGDNSDTIVINPDGATGPEILFAEAGFPFFAHILGDRSVSNQLIIDALGGSGTFLNIAMELIIGNGAMVSGGLDSVQPSTASTKERWHNPTLLNSWVQKVSPATLMQYRMLASPSNCVQIKGDIINGTNSNSTSIFQLPTGYRPVVNTGAFPVYTAGRSANNNPPVVFIDGLGNVTLFNCVGATE